MTAIPSRSSSRTGLHVGKIGDIERAILCGTSGRANLICEFFKAVGATCAEDGGVPFGCEMAGCGLADSTARARDEDDFIFDVRFHAVCSLFLIVFTVIWFC